MKLGDPNRNGQLSMYEIERYLTGTPYQGFARWLMSKKKRRGDRTQKSYTFFDADGSGTLGLEELEIAVQLWLDHCKAVWLKKRNVPHTAYPEPTEQELLASQREWGWPFKSVERSQETLQHERLEDQPIFSSVFHCKFEQIDPLEPVELGSYADAVAHQEGWRRPGDERGAQDRITDPWGSHVGATFDDRALTAYRTRLREAQQRSTRRVARAHSTRFVRQCQELSGEELGARAERMVTPGGKKAKHRAPKKITRGMISTNLRHTYLHDFMLWLLEPLEPGSPAVFEFYDAAQRGHITPKDLRDAAVAFRKYEPVPDLRPQSKLEVTEAMQSSQRAKDQALRAAFEAGRSPQWVANEALKMIGPEVGLETFDPDGGVPLSTAIQPGGPNPFFQEPSYEKAAFQAIKRVPKGIYISSAFDEIRWKMETGRSPAPTPPGPWLPGYPEYKSKHVRKPLRHPLTPPKGQQRPTSAQPWLRSIYYNDTCEGPDSPPPQKYRPPSYAQEAAQRPSYPPRPVSAAMSRSTASQRPASSVTPSSVSPEPKGKRHSRTRPLSAADSRLPGSPPRWATPNTRSADEHVFEAIDWQSLQDKARGDHTRDHEYSIADSIRQ